MQNTLNRVQALKNVYNTKPYSHDSDDHNSIQRFA